MLLCVFSFLFQLRVAMERVGIINNLYTMYRFWDFEYQPACPVESPIFLQAAPAGHGAAC